MGRVARELTSIVALAIALSGCSTTQESNAPGDDIIVPALPQRPEVGFCLAGIELFDDRPGDPNGTIVMPDALSSTGCFEMGDEYRPAPDLVPYRVISPLWSDGVRKERFIALPPGTTIGFRESGAWDFPDGASLIKVFALESEIGNPDSRRAIETRIMTRAAGRWHYTSYMWNDAGTEAFRNELPITVEFEVRDGGIATTIAFDFPSRRGCLACHAGVTGEALGPRTAQLNHEIHYQSGRQNQLHAMEAIGLFGDPLPGNVDAMPRFIDPGDTDTSLEARARSYLHGNCAHCHMPGGYNSTAVDIDLRSDVPLAEARICGQATNHPIFAEEGALVIDPGNPAGSNLYRRMIGNGISKMPPSGRSLSDPLGSELTREWIERLVECP